MAFSLTFFAMIYNILFAALLDFLYQNLTTQAMVLRISLKRQGQYFFCIGSSSLTSCRHTFKISQMDTIREFSNSLSPLCFTLIIKTLILFGHNVPSPKK